MAESKRNAWESRLPAPFKRKRLIATVKGVVECVNVVRGSYSARYAWITTERGIEVSIKLQPTQELLAGQIVSLTQGFSDQKHNLHSTEANYGTPIHILGMAKYVNRTKNGWAIAVTTRSQRRMKKPLLQFRMKTRPNFSKGQLVSFAARYDTVCPCGIASTPKFSGDGPADQHLSLPAEGIFLPDGLCEWLASTLEVNATLQAGLYGSFQYSLAGTPNLSLLDREEKAMTDSKLLEPQTVQTQLAKGLNEVRFIRPLDNGSSRKLREDLRLIDRAGLHRRVTVLMPIHELANAETLLSTSQSLLLKPGFVNVTQVLLTNGQRILFTTTNNRTTTFQRLAVISVSSGNDGSNSPPDVKVAGQAPGVTCASQSLWLKKHSTQSVKFLLQRGKAKEILSHEDAGMARWLVRQSLNR